jgi:WhiB family redox-sensing transcriptional regulator
MTTSSRPAHRRTQEFRTPDSRTPDFRTQDLRTQGLCTQDPAGRNAQDDRDTQDRGSTVNTSTAPGQEVSDVTRRHRLADLACRRFDAELWFAESPEDVELAKSLCTGCPLATACLAGALERNEPWGVWGGQLVLGGTVVPRKRPRGRPRKHPVAA